MESKLFDLTSPQKAIWLTEQFYKGKNINNICGTALIDTIIDFEKLQEAINIFIRDNDSFRIHLKLDENGNVKQYFNDFSPYKFEIIDLLSNDGLVDLESKMVGTHFNIIENDLFNAIIFRFPNETGGFIINVNHIVSDACTAGLAASKIINIYSALLNGSDNPEIPTSYINYINSENEYLSSTKFVKDKVYWENKFKNPPEMGVIPSVKPSTVDSSDAERELFKLDKSKVESITKFCSDNKISIFNFFMAVYAIYISRVSHLDKFVLGTPILNRTTVAEKNTPGMFISTVPFSFEIPNKIKFIDFVSNIAKDTLGMFRHQKYPYQNILEYIRSKNPGQPNLYDILISYQNTRANTNSADIPYQVRWSFNKNVADSMQIHLFDMNDEGLLNIAYDYRLNKYNKTDIEKLHKRILFIIEQVLNDSSITLNNIEIVTPQEKNLLLNTFNDTSYKYNKNLNVIDLFERQVIFNPFKVALISNNVSFTYKNLNEKANILAHYLKEKFDINNNDIVGIMLTRSPEMIIGLLAILKCGATYLPVDPDYPNGRISYMLENSNTKIVLVNNETEKNLSVDYCRVNISLDNNLYKTRKGRRNLGLEINPNSLAYVIYTSGSTGKPKGVMIKHNNLHNFVIGMKKLINFSRRKTLVSVTTICFDIFGLELWCSLTSGMTFVLANEQEQNVPELLNKLCVKNNVNIIQTTPSRYMNLLSNESNLDFLKSITDILVGGEALPQSLLSRFKQVSTANIYNMYGPTETTIWSTVKDLTNTKTISVGKPIINTQCYILDENRNLLPPYTPGELYIGGDGVSGGYLHRINLSETKFTKSPFIENHRIYNTNDLAYYTKDGEIMHLGRTDFQVKIRGYRIELGEIENRVIHYPNITNAVVVPDKENKYLICYYVSDDDIKPSNIISYLLKYLPNYMIPTYFMRLDKIPLTPNKKVDRKALPKIKEQSIEIELASTKTEKLISDVLSNILHTDKLDINTPFLSLGLDSLGLIQLQTALLSYNLNLTTQSFYRYPSIKRLAKKIDSNTEFYSESEFQIPAKFKHVDGEIDSKLDLAKEDVLGNVLLTGANGFIGIHVLHELLTTTESNVYCFVRAESIEKSIVRLENSYKFYFNSSINDYINKRIFVYNGQITSDNFALTDEQLDELKNNINTIIHTAAIVKHYGYFEEFKETNVDGTKRVADFAYKNKKRLMHISSISVSGNYLVKQDNQNVDFTENDLYIGQHYTNNVYVNSKFDAEKIVYSYMEKGLTAEVLRVGILSGRYSDGVFQENISANAFYSRIKSLISLRKVSNSMLKQELEFTPVDLCTKAIVLLSKTKLTENRVFHLYDHNLATIENIMKVLKTLNIPIETVSDKEFEKYILKLSEDPNNRNILEGIINDFSFNDSKLSLDYGYTVNISSKYTQQYLKCLGFEWSKVEKDYFTKIIKYMRKIKFI